MKVLAIGEEGVKDMALDMYPDSDVERVSLRPRKTHKDFDALLSYMTLSRVPFRKTKNVMKSWVDALKQDGEIVIFIPSLEWAAVQILTPEHSPALMMHLFGVQGGPEQFYSSGFTLLTLRSMCAESGIAITHAQTGNYMIGEYECECHVVRGVKK